MTDLEKLKRETTFIGKAIAEKVDTSNPQEVIGKLEELRALQAMSSYLVALADKVVKLKENEAIDTLSLSGLSATLAKKKIEGYAVNEAFYKVLTHRHASDLDNSLHALRSELSYLKEEFSQSKFHQ